MITLFYILTDLKFEFDYIKGYVVAFERKNIIWMQTASGIETCS